MIVEEQSNEFNRLTSPMMWEQLIAQSIQEQQTNNNNTESFRSRRPRNHQLPQQSLHGTYTIFWCEESNNEESLRYDITLNKDKSITNFILDAVDFFSQNSNTFANSYTDIENVKLFIAKENGKRSSTYPPVSIQEVPSVFTLFKTQRKRFFLLEIINQTVNYNNNQNNSNNNNNELHNNDQLQNSNSTDSSEMLINIHPKSKNYRSISNQVAIQDKITSIYSDKMRNSKVYNNSFHSQTASIKDINLNKDKLSQSQYNNNQQINNNKKSWLCFCCND